MADGNDTGKKPKGMRFSNLTTNKDKEKDGVWVDFESGFRIKIARLGSPRFKEFMVKASKPYMRKLQRGTIDNETADKMMRKALAKTILMDWEGLLDDQDQPIPFTAENALKCLEASDDFYRDVLSMCQERELYQADDKEAAAKNS